ncbi:hypothetical protein UlMin_034145 [Ulmus minor]
MATGIVEIGGEEVRNGDEQGTNSQEEKILVSVRLRPLNDKELATNDASDWECINNNTIIIKNSLTERSLVPTAYSFDRVFGSDCPTKQVYEEGAKEVILSVVNGINSSIFAYGQTSSGKTYTMNGITEHAVADIYNYIDTHIDRDFVLKFSAMEIYNEAVRDLLSVDGAPLRLLDDPEKGTVVERLTEEVLLDRDHLLELLSICEAQRRIGETTLNETSSRSHQIVRLTIESTAREYQGIGRSSTLAATVNFVDLAGSERASQTLSAGARLKEGCHINRSLLTLGTVIRKLSKGGNAHIPYRDSKLTRILQNSLGGNARTAVICTLSPAHSHIEQSRNTLFFASCAKEVTTNAKVNLMMSDKVLVKQLQKELAKMENELRSLTSKPVTSDSAALLKERELLIEQMAKEIQDLTRQRDLAESQVETILRSVGEDVPRSDERLGSELSRGSSHLHLDNLRIQEKSESIDEPNILNSNKHQRQFSQNSEDSFLLEDSTPKFVELDPCQGWEESARKVDAKSEDSCKEVRCIETEESSLDQTREAESLLPVHDERTGNLVIEEVNEAAVSSTQKEDKEFIHMEPDCSYDALKKRIQEMQRTINSLVNLYPSEQSPCSSQASMSSCGSFKLTRSRSCKAILTSSPSSIWFKETESNENTSFAGIEKDFQGGVHNFRLSKLNPSVDVGKFSRKDSHASNLSTYFKIDDTKDSDAEDTLRKEYPQSDEGLKQILPKSKYGLSRKDHASVLSSPLGTEHVKEFDAEDTSEEFSGRAEVLQRKLFKSNHSGKSRRVSRNKKHSRASVLSAPAGRYDSKESDSDDNLSVLNFVPERKEMAKLGYDSECSDNLEPVSAPGKLGGNSEEAGLETLQSALPHISSWPFEFERRRREIVELWHACSVPLIHRTYFFLLFKGEPSDSVYLEVELRRLSFLKETFSLASNTSRDGQIPTPASSMKILNREREMLSKQMHKKYNNKERERLYQKWGIRLNTKQRSLQLARVLWTNTRDIEHMQESAALVAKLVELVEPGQGSKEMLGLSFSLQPPINRKSFIWKHSLSSLS